MVDLTQILAQIENGDPRAAEQLFPLVYDELRKLAAARMANERGDHTLQATALVHEAYLKLVGGSCQPDWNSRSHFFASAAEAMRRILVDSARRRKREKHGGNLQRVDLLCDVAGPDPKVEEILGVNDALAELEKESPAKAQLVKLRYFAGFSEEEAAMTLGVSRATASRYWTYAKAFLKCELRKRENCENI